MLTNDKNLDFGTLAIPATSTISSLPISLDQKFGLAVQIFWIGTPTGAWTVEGSCDDGYIQPDGTVVGVSNWSTVSNTSVSVSGAAGNFILNVRDVYFLWFRVVYTASSSTGTIASAKFSVKGI